MAAAAFVDFGGQAQDQVEQALVAVDARPHQAFFQGQLPVLHLHQGQRHAWIAFGRVAMLVEQLAQQVALAVHGGPGGGLDLGGQVGRQRRIARAPEPGAPVRIPQRRRHAVCELQAEGLDDGAGRALVAGPAGRHQHRLVVGQAFAVAEPEREQAVDRARRAGCGRVARRRLRMVKFAAAGVDHHGFQAIA
jgi:hypothetical protein